MSCGWPLIEVVATSSRNPGRGYRSPGGLDSGRDLLSVSDMSIGSFAKSCKSKLQVYMHRGRVPRCRPWRVNWREFYDDASADALKAWQLRVQQSDFAMMQCVKSRKSAYKATV